MRSTDLRERFEIDLMTHYRRRMSEFRSGELTVREFGMMLEFLPMDSLVNRKLADRPDNDWTFIEHRVVDMLDSMNYLIWLTMCSNWDKKKNGRAPKAPKPIVRPGKVEEKPKMGSARDLARMLRGIQG